MIDCGFRPDTNVRPLVFLEYFSENINFSYISEFFCFSDDMVFDLLARLECEARDLAFY